MLDSAVNGNTDQTTRVPEFDDGISVSDVHKTSFNAKREKASGIDGLPSDVFRNDTSVSCLHILFNVCFDSGFVPSE